MRNRRRWSEPTVGILILLLSVEQAGSCARWADVTSIDRFRDYELNFS
jgi:hypothetical protein